MANYKFNFNGNISEKAIKSQISKWTKNGEAEKIKAHEFAVSLAMRYRDHGNYDLLIEVADAIGVKFTKHARTAFIEWIVKATSLGWDKANSQFIHKKGSERTFDQSAAIWNTGEAKHDSGWNENNHSFWTLVQKEIAPFDATKSVKALLSRAVKAGVNMEELFATFANEYKEYEKEANMKAALAKKPEETASQPAA